MPPGNYFSAKLGSGEFVRVKVTKVDRMNQACHSFLVDYGKEMTLDWDRLTNLHKDFLILTIILYTNQWGKSVCWSWLAVRGDERPRCGFEGRGGTCTALSSSSMRNRSIALIMKSDW